MTDIYDPSYFKLPKLNNVLSEYTYPLQDSSHYDFFHFHSVAQETLSQCKQLRQRCEEIRSVLALQKQRLQSL